MATDPNGNDLSAVNIPITGKAAFAPVDAANVISSSDGADAALALLTDYPAYKLLGLIKKDGGFEESSESGESTEFFQEGYLIAGESTITMKMGLAQGDEIVRTFLRGATPDANGRIIVKDAFRVDPFLLFTEVAYKNRAKQRRNGVAVITEMTQDKAERGTPQGWAVTAQWQPNDLFDGGKFAEWLIPAPTGA